MKTFLAKLVFQVTCDHHRKEFDEQYRIVHAGEKERAFLKAREIGAAEEGSFVTAGGSRLSWEFIGVQELFALDEVHDGGQLFSMTRPADDAASYMEYVKGRAAAIQLKSLTFA